MAASAFWFQISGLIGTVLFYICYELLFRYVPFADESRATASWTLSYLLSILWQHALHRYLVYGPSGRYWNSLFWTYVAYSISLVLSSVANHVLVTMLGVNHRVAFVATLIATGILNFHTVSAAFGAKPGADAATAKPKGKGDDAAEHKA